MLTRSNPEEQLKEYQIPSRNDWLSISNSSSRVDVIIALWEILMFACLVFTVVSLYYQHVKLALVLLSVTVIIFVSMKITKQVKQNRKSMRRMLLPLSM